jgi:hypothetical protein
MVDCPCWHTSNVSKQVIAMLLMLLRPTLTIIFPPVPDITLFHRTPSPTSPVTIVSSKNVTRAPKPSALNSIAHPNKPKSITTSKPSAMPMGPAQTLTPTVTQSPKSPMIQRPNIDTPFTAAPTASAPPATSTVLFNPVPMPSPSLGVSTYSISGTPQPVANSNYTSSRKVAAVVSAGLVALGLSALFLMSYFD